MKGAVAERPMRKIRKRNRMNKKDRRRPKEIRRTKERDDSAFHSEDLLRVEWSPDEPPPTGSVEISAMPVDFIVAARRRGGPMRGRAL